MVFSGIALTADVFGYDIPIPSVRFSNSYNVQSIYGTAASLRNSQMVNYSSNNTKEKSKLIVPVPNTSVPDNKTNTTQFTAPKSNIVTHVGFLKVHKAGSTTMQNMFFRFGLKHNLNVIIPKQGNYLFSRSSATVPKVPKGFSHYDIFACHTVYSKGLYSQLLPKDQVKIGIIREPLDRMISAAYYYRDVWGVSYLKKVPAANFIHNIVNEPEKYEKSFFSRTRNSMGKDFGFPSTMKRGDTTAIKQKLDILNQEFALVMKTEQFDESLVLMRRILSWSISDIIYLLANTHKHNPVVVSKEELEKFNQTSFLDFVIYEYFSRVFEKKITEAGEDFQEEVTFFKQLLLKVKVFCDSASDKTASLEVPKTKWDDSFEVTYYDCVWMKTQELAFISKLRKMYNGLDEFSYTNIGNAKR